MNERVAAEYVLPLRWSPSASARDLPELVGYLEGLVRVVDVTVVDGSGPAVYARHARALPPGVRHRRPEPWPGANGKVAGVVTGVRAARHERVVIADDDVRYGPAELAGVVALLDRGELVRPQNVFEPMPWHACWDTGRTLLNRAVGHDHPGTFGLRRDAFLAMGGYDGDVLFENLELARTVAATGGTEVDAGHVVVRRRPPTTRHFLGQRVRQAYDSLAEPQRLAAELSVLPLLAAAAAARQLAPVLTGVVAGTVATAEAGRRRAGLRTVLPATAALWAPAWLAERAVCSWLALGHRGAGGVRYGGTRLRTAAHPVGVLRASPRTPLTRAAVEVPHRAALRMTG